MSHKTTTEEGGNIIIEALPYGFDGLPEPLSNLRKKLYIKAKQESQRPYRPPQGITWYQHLYKNLGLIQL